MYLLKYQQSVLGVIGSGPGLIPIISHVKIKRYFLKNKAY